MLPGVEIIKSEYSYCTRTTATTNVFLVVFHASCTLVPQDAVALKHRPYLEKQSGRARSSNAIMIVVIIREVGVCASSVETISYHQSSISLNIYMYISLYFEVYFYIYILRSIYFLL